MTKYIKAVPTPKQAALMLYNGREAFYGGAAGGGKSMGLLMCALQYVDQPDYSALLLRRTFTMLNQSNGLIPMSKEWLMETDAKWSEMERRWVFPNGAMLSFGYLESENDKYQYQGAQHQFVGFDELTQFTESQYEYLFSRLRRLKDSIIPIRMRSTSNPGGVGHEWVRQKFVKQPKSLDRIFIPAGLTDNPYLDQAEYILALKELDPVTRAQLLNGDWDVRQGGDIFKREWLRYYDEIPGDLERVVQGWDLAITQRTTGDYTAGVTLGVKEGKWYVLDIFRSHVDFPTALRIIKSKAEQFNPEAIAIESNSYQLAVVQELRRSTSLPVVPQIAKTDKVQKLMSLGAFFEGGRILLNHKMQEFVGEYLEFPTGGHDDMLDALWYATERLKHRGIRSTNINIDDLGAIV